MRARDGNGRQSSRAKEPCSKIDYCSREEGVFIALIPVV